MKTPRIKDVTHNKTLQLDAWQLLSFATAPVCRRQARLSATLRSTKGSIPLISCRTDE